MGISERNAFVVVTVQRNKPTTHRETMKVQKEPGKAGLDISNKYAHPLTMSHKQVTKASEKSANNKKPPTPTFYTIAKSSTNRIPEKLEESIERNLH